MPRGGAIASLGVAPDELLGCALDESLSCVPDESLGRAPDESLGCESGMDCEWAVGYA